jgi:hypothetical protein
MARSLDQIRRDQDRLEQATTQINTQLADVYQQYLQILGGAVQQQLILGTYHLCTQTYPEAFLKLSLSQREKLQQDMRQLGQKGKTHIKELAHVDNMASTLKLLLQSQSLGNAVTDLGKHEKTRVDTKTTPRDPAESAEPTSPDSDPRLAATVEPAEVAPQSILLLSSQTSQPFDGKAVPPTDGDAQTPDATEPESAAETESADIAPSGSSTTDIANIALSPKAQPRVEALSPLKLAKRHVLLERQIRAVLHSLSNLANHALQQAQILPDLPEAVLTAATEAEADEQAPSVPNLLNVIVEIGGDRPEDTDSNDALEEEPLDTELEAPERTMTHLVAINLRLADIEFTDTRTALWRSKIQEILRQLKKLSRHYQKLQQERAQAEAEAAWRAIWFEEGDQG